MLNFSIMDEIVTVKNELERTKVELGILYEISNAMRTTLKLDEILYIILTGVTAHIGLGFNRAMLFLIDEKNTIIEGKMGIGPDTGEEANAIWSQIEQEAMGLDDLINAYKSSKDSFDSDFNNLVTRLKVPLDEKKGGVLALCVFEGMPLHLTRETIKAHAHDQVISLLKPEEIVIVPLKAKDKVNGIILADNFITKKPITKDEIRMLIMLSNQAGLAIENSQLYEKTVNLAHTDYLTTLWNHGYFQHLLHEELEKAKTFNTPLSLIMIDIDDFKIYNDTLGHQAGDQILKDLALILKNQSRKMDYVCRYGGEEFTVILPQTDKREAFFIAERLRDIIAKYHFVHEEILPSKILTISLGVSTFPDNGASASELITTCDKALYQAKYKGKNTFCG
jgi:diguanylate cyclase (GGDEF)-like protein